MDDCKWCWDRATVKRDDWSISLGYIIWSTKSYRVNHDMFFIFRVLQKAVFLLNPFRKKSS